MPSPRPRLAPVTRTVRADAAGLDMAARQFAGCRDVEGRHDADRRRNLVDRQRVAAELQDIALDGAELIVRALASRFQDDIGDHDRAGGRTFLWPHQRHADLRVPVDHRLDLFGMNLEAADIDDAATAAGESVTGAVQFNDVAGIDEALFVEERRGGADIARCRARRADAQRAVFNLHLDAVARLPDIGRGKACKAVVDVEGDTGLGRSISVADARPRKRGAQT